MNVTERLTFFSSLYRVDQNPEVGMWLLYGTIVGLAIIVYKLGFAQKLSFVKSFIVYLFLVLGSTILTFFGAFLPIAEGLVVAAIILIIYKLRLHQQKQGQQKRSA